MKKSPLPLFVLALAPLSISITALEAQAFPGKKEYTVTIAGDDAKALYERLEKKEFGGDGDDKRLITKIGQNVLCTREKLNKNPVLPKYEYKCALSFLIETGELHEMYPIGEDDSEAGLKEDEDGYQGRSVNVKAGGEEATFTIHGIQAQELFDGMNQKEEPARIRDGKLSPVEKEAKSSVLKELSDEAAGMMKEKLGGLGGMKKATIMAASPEGMKKGAELVEKIAGAMPNGEESEGEEREESALAEAEGDEESSQMAEAEEGEEKSKEELLAELESLKAKIEAMG
jgi:hypothetical protein